LEITSVHIIENNRIVARIGVTGRGDNNVASGGGISPGKILLSSINNQEEIYLPGYNCFSLFLQYLSLNL